MAQSMIDSMRPRRWQMELVTGPMNSSGETTSIDMTGSINSLRLIFFVLTFFTIGLVSNFRRLWAEGIGKLAAVYCVCLFGFIIWVGLFISWLFFHGVKPPLVGA